MVIKDRGFHPLPHRGVQTPRTPHYVLFFCIAVLFSACESPLDDQSSDLPLASAAPPSIQITSLREALLVQWTKVSPAQGVDASYELHYSEFSDMFQPVKVPVPPPPSSNLVKTTITDLENRKTYYVRVKTIFPGLGESDFSEVSSGIPVPPPALPGLIRITPGESLLDLSWDPVPDAFTYNVFYAAGQLSLPTAGTEIQTVSDAGAVITGLTNGTYHTVWVQAANTAGESEFRRDGGTPKADTSKPSYAPVIKSVTPGNGKISLSWEPVRGVPQYEVYYHTTDKSAEAAHFTVEADAPAVMVHIPGLTNGTLYYVWVTSKNRLGESSSSLSNSGTPQAKPPINWSNSQFALGYAAAEYIFAQTVPKSVFFHEGDTWDRLTRVQETALGNLFTDGGAWYVREILHEEIDFVFLNGGYIDNLLRQGTVTTGSIGSIAKAYDQILLLSLTGRDLKELFGVTSGNTPIPYSVAAVTHMGRGGANTGEFGIVSSEIRYTIEYPKSPGGTSPVIPSEDKDKYWHGRIKAGTLKFKGEDIIDNRTYRIATTDYNASGVYYLILNTKGTNKRSFPIPFHQAVGEYIYDQGVITPKLDGRIMLEGGVPLPPPWKNSEWNPYNH